MTGSNNNNYGTVNNHNNNNTIEVKNEGMCDFKCVKSVLFSYC